MEQNRIKGSHLKACYQTIFKLNPRLPSRRRRRRRFCPTTEHSAECVEKSVSVNFVVGQRFSIQSFDTFWKKNLELKQVFLSVFRMLEGPKTNISCALSCSYFLQPWLQYISYFSNVVGTLGASDLSTVMVAQVTPRPDPKILRSSLIGGWMDFCRFLSNFTRSQHSGECNSQSEVRLHHLS